MKQIINHFNQRTEEATKQALDLLFDTLVVNGTKIKKASVRVSYLENASRQFDTVCIDQDEGDDSSGETCIRRALTERIEVAGTDGNLIFVNRIILTPGFEQQTKNIGRFRRPEGVTHYAGIMLHEVGHIYHIRPETSSLFNPVWRDFTLRRLKGKTPTPRQLTEFNEEAADCFATSFISLGFF